MSKKSASRDQARGRRAGHQAPAGYDVEKFERPSVACDVVIVRFRGGRLEALLIKRGHDPYQGLWALPGGFVDMDEDLPTAAAREVMEETAVTGLSLVPLGAYGDPGRDPRTRVISAAFLALVPPSAQLNPVAGDDAREVGWRSLRRPPELAFDHDLIMKDARGRLVELALLTPRLLELLPKKFAADDLHALCQIVMNRRYDRARWVRRLRRLGALAEAGTDADGRGLYRYSRSKHRTGDFTSLLL